MKSTLFSNFTLSKVVLFVITVICLLGGSYSVLRIPTKNDDTIVVGMMSGWAPFMSIAADGSYVGFDVDVAQELARRMNKKIIIYDMGSLVPCFIALEQNKIDMIFSGLDINQTRLQRYNMVYYAGNNVTSYDLLFWKQIPEGVKTIQDLKKYPQSIVVVEPGDSPEKYLDRYDYIVKKQISAITDQLMDLQYGKSTAIFRQAVIAQKMCAQYPQLKSISVPLPLEYQIYGMGIALKKDNTSLTVMVQTTIEGMIADGTIKKLELKWQLNGDSNEL
jgi:ABC-type amino acid transport substrate-binding protein